MSLFLVEFSSSWCLPGQAMKPILVRLAKEYRDRVDVSVINVDQNPLANEKHEIQVCPTFILFRDSEELSRTTGAQTEGQLREIIEEWI